MLGVRQFQGNLYNQMRLIFKQLGAGQNPEILFITCSDSRLTPSLFTQTQPGELFVIRNVGNIIPPADVPSSEGAGIEYALNELAAIKDIIICGHSHCGAMKGLLTPSLKERLPKVASWLTHSHSVLKQIDHSAPFASKVHNATKLNILEQIEHLKTYPIIAEKLARNELTLHGWFYEFETGEIFVYEHQFQKFLPFKEALAIAVSARRDKLIEQIFLTPSTHPKNISHYKELMQLFSLIEKNILPVGPAIKKDIIQKLRFGLSKLHPNIHSASFTSLLEKRFHHLKDFQKNRSESLEGRYYLGEMMRYSLFASSDLLNLKKAVEVTMNCQQTLK